MLNFNKRSPFLYLVLRVSLQSNFSEMMMPEPKFEVHYRHPAAVFVSGLVSLVYVVLCWLSYIVIILSSCAVIIGLFVPRLALHVLNQYHIERQFKDEL